ncbi:MAG: IS4 family transposase [Leptospiraceae bacterium]|nr:IS4 family transposase [Leptospiraceae bacterium]
MVLAIQDTSSTNYTSHKKVEGMGKQGNDKSLGFMLHPTLAVGTEGTPLGILDMQIWTREEAEESEEVYIKKKEAKTRTIEEKESIKWIKSYNSTCEFENQLEGEIHFVNVCDREGDMFKLFNEYANSKYKYTSDLLVRACQNMNIEEENKHLWDYVTVQPEAGEVKIQVPRREGKKARETTLIVRYCEVTIMLPKTLPKLKPIKVYAVYTLEKETQVRKIIAGSNGKNQRRIKW